MSSTPEVIFSTILRLSSTKLGFPASVSKMKMTREPGFKENINDFGNFLWHIFRTLIRPEGSNPNQGSGF